jgi:hypothetical protein
MVERSIATAIAHQDVIGWKAFLEGIIFDDILQIQTEYYKTLQRRSTGLSWLTKLSKFRWEMIHTLWMERNEQTQNLQNGKKMLLLAIQTEHEIGRSALPFHMNHPSFNLTLERLLQKSI